MKKMLSLFGIISLVATSTLSLVACNTPQYTEKELANLKEKNNIKTRGGILEWISPQEKLFDKVDDKYYFVVWRSDENANWRIIEFKNITTTIKIDGDNNRQLEKTDLGMGRDLYITNKSGIVKYVTHWTNDNGYYFKSVYRWDNDNKPNIDVKNKLKIYLDL